MMPIEAPKANPENLLDIIKAAHDARVVVPEFQRSFVWGREDIEEFLTSVLEGYFVGTFLILDTPTDGAMFPFRVVEGLEKLNGRARPDDHATVRLVLDGQQRISSVFYALYEPKIPLRGTRYPYRFFLQLEPALNGNMDEAVVGISTWDRRRTSEMDSLLKEHKALPFPLLRDSSRFYNWLYQEQQTWSDKEQQQQLEALYQRFQKFMVPVVSLSADTGKENIVNIFERINRTGISLSLFDLMAARLYTKGLRLRDLWKAFEKEHKQGVAAVIKPEFLLKVIALLEGKEPRKRNLLKLDNLSRDRFLERWNEGVAAVAAAYGRISKEYGAFEAKWIPYTTLLVPLAVMLHKLKQQGAAAEDYWKLNQWYWSSVFGQRYDSAVDSKSGQDVREVLRWIDGGDAPGSLVEARLRGWDLEVDEPRSAVYRGVMCLVARNGARDFLTGQAAPLQDCDDDHIFPKSLLKGNDAVHGIVNRTLIWADTNRKRKSDKKPSAFMGECLRGHGGNVDHLLQTLATHFIDQNAYDALKADDFGRFLQARQQLLDVTVARHVREVAP